MEISVINFWLGVFVILCGIISGALRIGFVTGKLIETIKAEFNARLVELEAEQDEKIARVYTRLDIHKDQVKKELKEDYVKKEVCSLIHVGAVNATNSLEHRVASLEIKIDELKTLIMNMHNHRGDDGK